MLKLSWVDRVDAVDPLSRDTLYPVRREIYPIYPVYPIYPRSGRVICFFNSVIASSSYPHSSQAFSNVTGVGTTTLTRGSSWSRSPAAGRSPPPGEAGGKRDDC